MHNDIFDIAVSSKVICVVNIFWPINLRFVSSVWKFLSSQQAVE
jgi:heme/copper-type cytochrome/quinol oxidase subunit 2